ncbi:MAG: NUDIX hydrolase [Anaerolineae bacterium]
MSRKYPKQPIIGVGVVVVKDNRVLVIQRGKEPGAGSWAFPGGRLELGETLADAAVREALEETGLTVKPGDVIAVIDLIDRDETGNIRYHYVVIDLLAQLISGAPRPGDDSVAVRWIGLQEAEELPMAPRMVDVVRQLLGDRDAQHD